MVNLLPALSLKMQSYPECIREVSTRYKSTAADSRMRSRQWELHHCSILYTVTTGNGKSGNTKMAASEEDKRKKLQITERLQKREEERLQNIQQRKIAKEDETASHVRRPGCLEMELLY